MAGTMVPSAAADPDAEAPATSKTAKPTKPRAAKPAPASTAKRRGSTAART